MMPLKMPSVPPVPRTGAAIALMVAVVVFCFAGTNAATAADVRLNASSYGALPADALVEVVAMDDTDFNIQIGSWIQSALSGTDHRPGGADARLELSFETLTVVSKRSGGSIGEIHVDTLAGSHLKLNMWSTRGASLLGEPTKTGAEGHLLLFAVIYDKVARERLWEAEVVAPASAAQNQARLKWICDMIAEHLGKPVQRKTLAFN